MKSLISYDTAAAAIAQPVEHRIRNARVGGSSPFGSTSRIFDLSIV